MFRPEKFYRDQHIDLIADRAVAIDRTRAGTGARFRRVARLCHLVLATGARNRLLDIPNANLEDVRYLRTLDESETLRQRFAVAAGGWSVIGAGFIGLEFAATARAKGLEVDVVELAPRVMARAVTPEISAFFQRAPRRGRHSHAFRRAGDQHRKRSWRDVSGVSLSDGRPCRPTSSWSASACCRTSNWRRRRGCTWPRASSSTSSCAPPTRIFQRSAIARCLPACASARRCGLSRCRTRPIRRAAWRRG